MPWDRPRDPARIDTVLAEVKACWALQPDLRLGQLVRNAATVAGVEVALIEDDRLVDGLHELERRGRNAQW